MPAGIVEVVEERRYGSELTGDLLAGSDVIGVEDPADFSPDGGELELGGVEYGYSAVEDNGDISLDAGLDADAFAGDPVWLAPATVERFAHVRLDDQEEALVARVPHALYDRLPVGVREESPEPELAELGRDPDGELIVSDVLVREPQIDGSYIDPDTLPEPPPPDITDGDPPAISPPPIVAGGVRSLFVSWLPIANADPVTYEVHVSTASGFTADDDTYAGEVSGTRLVITELPDGTPLDYEETYYVRTIAKDADGAAAQSTEASGAPVQVDTPDIAVEAVTADRILANSITADRFAATLVLTSLLTTAESGQRVAIDTDGIRLYSPDGEILVDIPTDPTKEASFSGDITARQLTVLEGATFRGSSYLDKGASLNLLERTAAPGTAPTLTIDHDYQELGAGLPAGGTPLGLYYDAAGGAGGSTASWLTTTGDGSGNFYVQEYRADTGAFVRQAALTPSLFGITRIYGAARLGSYVYALVQVDLPPRGDPAYYLVRVNQAAFTYDSASLIASPGTTVFPECIGADGTNLLVMVNRVSLQPQVRRYDGAMALVSTTTFTGWPTPLTGWTYKGIVAQGGSWWVCAEDASLTYSAGTRCVSTAGAYTANRDFYVSGPATGQANGLAHDGTRFWTLAATLTALTPRLVRHSTWDWTTENATYWVGYTWRTDAGPYETTIGPRASISLTGYRRARVAVSVPAFPSGVTGFRVYVDRAASAPATTSLKRQAASTYLTSETVSPGRLIGFDTGGAAPPTSNTYPGGISEIRPSNTSGLQWFLAGDGGIAVRNAFDVQELVSNAGSVNLTGSVTQVDSVTLTKPTGWNSFDAILLGRVTLAGQVGSDHRAAAQLESPSGTALNVPSAAALPNTTVATDPATVPLQAYLSNLSANQVVRIVAQITGGTTTSGDVTALGRYLTAILIRRT